MNFTTLIKTLLLICLFGTNYAQEAKTSALYKTLKTNDSLLFDVGFNTCDLSAFESLLADDLEFYHDVGGVTNSKEEFITIFKNGICKRETTISRRALDANSLQVFPLYNNGALYGALQNGVHRFYETPIGQTEQPGSIATFTHLWLKTESGWTLKRVISYDHQPIAVHKDTAVVAISEAKLKEYSGTYKAPNTGTVVISIAEGTLVMNATNMTANIYPSSPTTFYHKEAPLSFEFIQNEEGQTVKFIVIENGKKVEEAVKQ